MTTAGEWQEVERADCCNRCKYYVPGRRDSTEPHDGTCRYHPPSNYSTPRASDDDDDDEPETVYDETDGDFVTLRTITYVDNTYTGWPIVQATDWCGCYEARTKPRAARKPKDAA